MSCPGKCCETGGPAPASRDHAFLLNLVALWWRRLLYLAWIWVLIAILIDRSYLSFLRPEFGYVIMAGLIALFGFFVVAMIENNKHPMKIEVLLRVLILVVPLLHVHNAREAHLGASAYRIRTTGTPTLPESAGSSRMHTVSSDDMVAADSDTAKQPEIPKSRHEKPEIYEINLLQLYSRPAYFNNRVVRLKGMIHHDHDMLAEGVYDDGGTVLFRFMINCCVADAVPLAVLIDSPQRPPFSSNTWLKAEGKFIVSQEQSGNVPILVNPVLKEIPAPELTYMFPSWMTPTSAPPEGH